MSSTQKKQPQSGVRRAEANAENHPAPNSTRPSSATEAQRERILRALRRGPQSTDSLRKMGVMMPAARVKELRDRFGCFIETTRITMVDRDGFIHCGVALYSLVSEAQ